MVGDDLDIGPSLRSGLDLSSVPDSGGGVLIRHDGVVLIRHDGVVGGSVGDDSLRFF